MALTPAERVRYWVRDRRITIRHLAKLTGFKRGKVGNIVAGRTQPRSEDLEVFARALGLTMGEFFGEVGTAERKAG